MVRKILMKNKRAWVRILEAFFAVMLILGIALVVLNRNSQGIEKESETIYREELSILREIELDPAAREEIVSAGVPVSWDDFDSEGLSEVKNKIIAQQPNYLNCSAKLCGISDACEADIATRDDIYAVSAGIYADINTYSPRKLKLFCRT